MGLSKDLRILIRYSSIFAPGSTQYGSAGTIVHRVLLGSIGGCRIYQSATTRRYHGRVGVFAGITKTGFDLYGPDLWRQGEANLSSYFVQLGGEPDLLSVDLQGPSMPIDTMCSASLTAIHEACEHLLAANANWRSPEGLISTFILQVISDFAGSKCYRKTGNARVLAKGAMVLCRAKGLVSSY